MKARQRSRRCRHDNTGTADIGNTSSVKRRYRERTGHGLPVMTRQNTTLTGLMPAIRWLRPLPMKQRTAVCQNRQLYSLFAHCSDEVPSGIERGLRQFAADAAKHKNITFLAVCILA
jgi:hypothetical protein